MTRSHFRLAGGPLSVMIYWFPSPVLQLDFSISHSLLLFYRHHRLERRWKDKQLQPAKLFKKQRTKMCGKTESHSWLAAESLMLRVWKGTVWKMVFQLCDTSVCSRREIQTSVLQHVCKGTSADYHLVSRSKCTLFLDWQTFISTF